MQGMFTPPGNNSGQAALDHILDTWTQLLIGSGLRAGAKDYPNTRQTMMAENEDLMAKLLSETMAENGLSMRQAAKQIGVSHATIMRVLNGDPSDLETARKIAGWLRVPVVDLLDLQEDETDTLARLISAVFHQEPALVEIFDEAMKKVLQGDIPPRLIREAGWYLTFRINSQEAFEKSNN
jgi:transcriptional regulator with XRE-family HTH domain